MPALFADEATGQYLADIANSRPLSREREIELAERIHQGDEEARNELVQANLRFVVDVAKSYQNRGLALSDLISAGNLGLLTAAERFDGTKGFKFISYAVWWIKQAILQAIAEQARIMRLPLNRLALLRDISQAARRLGQDQEVEPDAEEIAAELEVSVEEVEQTLLAARSVRSLDALFEEEDKRSLLDILPDEGVPRPDGFADGDELKGRMDALLDRLDERERRIIIRYFGLDGEEPMTLDQIGVKLGITRERVRQLKVRALSKMRHPSKLDEYRAQARVAAIKPPAPQIGGNGRPKPGNGHPAALPPVKKLVADDKAKFILMAAKSLTAALDRPPRPDEIVIEAPDWLTEEDVVFVQAHPELYE